MKKNVSLSLDDRCLESFENLPELQEEQVLRAARGGCEHRYPRSSSGTTVQSEPARPGEQ